MRGIELPDLNGNRLAQRITFLESRAATHLKTTTARANIPDLRAQVDGPTIHLACAGTLLRDAGATALLLGELEQARALLEKAGKIWSEIGLFAGYLLLGIANVRPWWLERREDLAGIDLALSSESLSIEVIEMINHQREDRPLLMPSASSTRQLLDLYQSLQVASSDPYSASSLLGKSDAIAAKVRSRLIEARAVRVAGAVVPATTYFELLDGVRDGKLNRMQQEALISLIARRQECLSLARKDTYRWDMMVNPSEIIDFDFLSLCLLAVASDNVHLLKEHFRERDDRWVTFPLTLAEALHESSPPYFPKTDIGRSDAGMI